MLTVIRLRNLVAIGRMTRSGEAELFFRVQILFIKIWL
jgi:hypothetical protein